MIQVHQQRQLAYTAFRQRHDMPRDDYDDDDDEEAVEPWDEDSEDETCPCPYCGAAVYEDAEWCPHCEKYLSDEDAPSAGKPWWIVAGVLAVLTAFLWTMFR